MSTEHPAEGPWADDAPGAPAAQVDGAVDRPGRRAPSAAGRGPERLAARGIPEATVARLPVYLRALTALVERGVPSVSSEELAVAAGVGSAKLRKDLSHLGSYGVRGVGYEVSPLVAHISRELGLTQEWRVVIVGIGNLGRALASHGGFAERGMCVTALFDNDPAVVGREVAGLTVLPMTELAAVVRRDGVSIGVLATPGPGAQPACDHLVAAGVTGVLTFAPAVLQVPEGVDVRKVDLASELQILAFHEQRKSAGEAVRAASLAVAAPAAPADAAAVPAGAVAAAPGRRAARPVGVTR
ncbi:redox-sensing transcriptional repressor Rex [Pseudokineococcus lusitanus]|uniref:Redox-sensing transcriptional repressor Rex n=1 Tax=Pseudokineococcus lusitanus TaxID=763993 RepID=A0A3N1HL87_9ACTN|nr:redox-sensing transcriptional repressor Rex [Pseudokineococcus lusitanus]ROP43288.1 redox-sensing transcriptional repressor [Pseudokineococcus lusitanus]